MHNRKIVNGIWDNNVSWARTEGKMLTSATFWRGNRQIAMDEMNEFNQKLYYKMDEYCAIWIGHNFQSGYIDDGGFECYKDKTILMGTTVMNTTTTRKLFERLRSAFSKMFQYRCHGNRPWISHYARCYDDGNFETVR